MTKTETVTVQDNVVNLPHKSYRKRPVYVFEETMNNYRILGQLHNHHRGYCRMRRGPVRIGLDRQQIQKGKIVMEPFNSEVLAALADLPHGRLLYVETVDALMESSQ